MSRYCGQYGCKNCKWFRCYPSNSYYEPDEYECEISQIHIEQVNNEIDYTDDEIDDRMTRAYSNGEEWDINDEMLCPYYIEYEEKYF